MRKFVLVSFALFLSFGSMAQLTGVKTIKSSGGDYATFTDAITALNTAGVGVGGVTFNVDDDLVLVEDPPAITATGTAANPIVFQCTGTGANRPVLKPTGTAGTSDFGFCISGGDYITFNGIDVTENSGSLVEYGFLIRNGSASNGAWYNTIKYCKVTLNRTNINSFGIMQSANSSKGGGTTPSVFSGTNSYNKYYNITIENSYSGISLFGNSSYPFDKGNEIGTTGTGSTTIGAATADDIGGNGTYDIVGILSRYQSGVKIFNTEIRNLTAAGTADVYGIYSTNDEGNGLIYNNEIHDLASSNINSIKMLYGICAKYPALTVSIYNNAVYNFSYDLTASSWAYGIYVYGATTANVYYNTVRMNLLSNKCASVAFNGAITNLNVANNIFAIYSTSGAGATRFCYFLPTNSPTTSSNNILYADVTGLNTYIGYISGSSKTTLPAFAAAISAVAPAYGLEGGSSIADPNFTSATDLTFAGATPARNSGIPIAGITTDINGTARDLTRPTIGAYETTQPLDDKSAPVFSNLSVSNGLTPSVSINLKDNSNSATNSTIRLWYRLSAGAGAFTALDADLKPSGAMNGTYTWNTSVEALAQGTYTFYIAARDDQGAGSGIWTYPMWASTWTGFAGTDPPNFTANPDGAANTNTFVKKAYLAGGTYEVGDDQPVLKKLTDVATLLNASVLQGDVTYELNSTYIGTTGETFPIVFNQYGTMGGNWAVTVRVKTGVSPLTTSGNAAYPLIRLDGADNFTFDGRAGGSGSTIVWNIKNTNLNGNAFTFINDAQSNTIQYCDVASVNNTASLGVITFGTTTGSNGNDNNTISYCNIHDDGTNFPLNGIYSQGSTTSLSAWNSGITVSNCNIYNFYKSGGDAAGIKLFAGSTAWTVTANSFYQTATRTPAAASSFTGILMGSGDGHNISSNYVGGSEPLCAGRWTVSGTTYQNVFYGIQFGSAMLPVNASSVQGNTISKISFGTTTPTNGTDLFAGIQIAGGICNVGNVTANTIGSGTETGSIVISAGTDNRSSNYYGIDYRAKAGLLQNNIVGGITISGNVSNTNTCALYGLNFASVLSGDVSITGNLVGSLTAANSIQSPSAANPAIRIYGINSNPAGGYGNVTIYGNAVANITNNNTSSSSLIAGIYNSGSSAPTTISQNMIRDFLSASTNTNSTSGASIIGILAGGTFAGSSTGQVIKQNIIYNFSNTAATAAVGITGIFYNGPGTGTNILEQNFIHSFSLSSTSAVAVLYGIYVQAGLSSVKNNMIRLGVTSEGSSLATSSKINGIYETGNSTRNSYYNNSVYIGGTGVGTTGSTYCFWSAVTTNPRIIADNIFFNARSGGSSGKHYAIRVEAANTAGLYSNYNLLLANGATGGTLGWFGADMADIAAWKASTGQDMASGNGDPNFINATGTSADVDLHVQSPTPVEAAGIALSSVTNDYDGQNRSSLTPPDIGADAGNFTASADIFGPNITFNLLGNGGIANRVLSNFATITDNVGVASGANAPRLYYKKSTDNNAFAGNTSAGNGWKYVVAGNATSPYSFTIDYSLLQAPAAPADVIQYFVVAQDDANNLSSNRQGATASGTPPVTLINGAPASPNSYIISIATISGTVTVPGTYTTLTGTAGLFEAINNSVLTGNIIANITADLTEPGTVALNQFNENPFNSSFTLTIQPGDATEKVISGAVATGMIRLDGAHRATIDGRFSGSGHYLRFRNTNTSNPTFTFLNDATYNTIKYCYIEGANTGSSSGVIVFSTTTGSTGNGFNTINSNIIRDCSDASGVPAVLLYSSGTLGKENAYQTISGNEFFNYSDKAISLTSTGNGDGMNISDNSIYQTASRTTTLYGISIAAGNGHTISGNSFGGSNASRTGAATQTTGSYQSIYGISLSVGMVTPTSVQGNTFSNFGSALGSSFGMNITSGNVNVGTVTGNTFGGGALASDTIIGGSGNIIISSSSPGFINVENNVIGNVAYYGGSSSLTAGMYFSNGILSIKNNIIRDIKSNSSNPSVSGSNIPLGLLVGTSTPSNIEGNTIYNITNTNTGDRAYVAAGIVIYNVWNNATVQKNKIYNIKALGTGASAYSPQVYGIYAGSTGSATYSNNLISLGQGTDGEPRLYGMQDASTGVNNYYYNSVNIYGTGSGSNSSYAFLKSSTSIVTLKDNILSNARTGGSVKSCAIGASSTSGFESNYNDLYSASGPLGLWGAADKSDLAAWQTASSGDAASLSVNPGFLSDTDLRTCLSALSGAGTAVSGITTDYAGVTRGNPPAIGAFEFSVPVPTIAGEVAVCQNVPGFVYTTESGKTGYAWLVSGGTITSGGTGADNTVTITWTTAGEQTVSVNYFNASGCAAASPTVKNVTVISEAVGGSIAGSTIVCSGPNSTLLTLSGYAGNISKWQYSTDNWLTPVDIANTATTYTATNLTTTTKYRAVITISCGPSANSSDATLTFNLRPVPTITGNTGVCAGTTGLVYSTETGKTGYTWVVSAGGSITAGGTSSDNTVTVTWNTAGVQTVSVNYNNASGCQALSPTVYNVTVSAIPAPTITGSAVECAGTTGVTYVTEASMSGYTWIVSAGGSITAGSGTNTITVTWNTAGAQTVSVNYQNSYSCQAVSPTVNNITVNPLGQVNQPANQVVCNATATAAVTLGTTNIGGTSTYTWTNDTPGIGLLAFGTGNIASFTAVNAGTTPVVATIVVTPTYTNGALGCAGPTKTFSITVNPTGQVTLPADQVVCNGSATSVTFATLNNGGTTTYAWTNTATSIGLGASGTGNLSFTATNTGTAPVAATIVVTPTFTNGSVGCAGPSKTFTITVNPTGQVNQPASQVVCNNTATSTLTFGTTNTSGTTTYAWTNDTPGIGLLALGTGNIASFTAVNTGTTPVVATIVVTPTFTNGSVGCAGPSKTFSITVNPTGQVTQPADQTVCSGSATSVTFATVNTVGTTTYAWTNNNVSIGLSASGTGNISFTPTNTGSTPLVAAIVVTPTFTNGSAGCAGPSKTFTITVNPSGQVNQPANQVVCNTTATTAVTFSTTSSGVTTTYAWTNDTPGIGLAASGTGNIASFTAVNTGTAPVVATIVVTPTVTTGSAGCAGPAKTFTITVNPTGQVTQPLSQVVCNGSATSVTFATVNTGGTTTYAWTNDTPGIGLLALGTGNIASFTAVNTGTSPVVATIVVTPTFTNSAVGCAGSTKTFTITVNPTGQVTQPVDQVVCNGSATSVTFATFNNGGTTTYAWTNTATSIGLGASGTGNLSFTATNTGTAPVAATIVVTPTFTNGSVGCAGPSKTFTITVNPTGQVNQPINQVVCNNTATSSVTFGTTNTGGTTTYAWTNDTPGIGLLASGSGNIASFTAVNTGTSPVIATIVVTPTFTNGSVGCAGPTKIFTITVNPTGQVTQPADQVVCNGAATSVTFATLNTGGTTTYAWTNTTTSIGLTASGTGNISFTATNTGIVPVIATIVVTPAFTNGTAGCAGPARTFTITVNPTAQVNQPASQVVCNNTSTATVVFGTTNTGGITTYAWTNDTPGIGLSASGSGNIASFTAANTGTSPVIATIVVTPTFANGSVNCSGSTKTFTITVNPTGQVNQPADQVVCNSGSTTAVTFGTTNTGGTTTYAWTNTTPGIGLSASGTGNIASFTAVNTGTSPVVATIVVTPTFTNGAVGCAGPTKTFTITVNPTGQVNQPASQVLCNATATAAVIFGTTNTGGTTTYAWTNTTPGIGLLALGTGNIASFTAVNTGTSPVIATIVVTPTFTNGSVGCAGPTKTFTITVNPTGQVNQPANQVVCNTTSTATVVFGTTNTGGTTTYAWTNDTPGIGLLASGTGNIASFTAVNTGTSPVVATIVVTPTFTNGAVGCAGPTKTFTITVNPTGQVTQPVDQVVCNGAATTVTFATVNTGGTTTYAWANNNPGIGLPPSGTGNISFNAINTGTSPVTATFTVTPTFTNGAVGCAGPSKTFTITVNPTGQVNQPSSQVLCHNTSTNAIVFSTVNSGGTTTYAWTNSAPSIGLPASGSGNILSFTAINTGTVPVIATIVVTPTFTNGSTGCAGPTRTFTITVNPLPVPTITGQTSNICPGSGYTYYSTEYGNSNYIWTISPGEIIVTGQGTAQVEVYWTGSGPQWIAVSYTYPSGCTPAASTQLNLNVIYIPGQAGTITGTDTVCAGTPNVVYSVDTISNATVYLWTLPAGASIVSGSGTNSITVNFASNALSGNITVCGNNICGNGAVSTPFAVMVNPIPPRPAVTANGYTLTSSASNGNQWYHNGNAVAGATQQVYIVPATDPGHYWTIVTLSECTSDSSNHVYIAGVGIRENKNLSFNVYPVPNNGVFTAEVSSGYSESYHIQIYNTLGVMVYKTEDFRVAGKHEEIIDVSFLPAGIYSVVFKNDQRQIVRKIFINK